MSKPDILIMLLERDNLKPMTDEVWEEVYKEIQGRVHNLIEEILDDVIEDIENNEGKPNA